MASAPEERWESVAERRIREAMERGDFDSLPGSGRPLPDAGTPYDEMWWVKRWIERERHAASGSSGEPVGTPPGAGDGTVP